MPAPGVPVHIQSVLDGLNKSNIRTEFFGPGQSDNPPMKNLKNGLNFERLGSTQSSFVSVINHIEIDSRVALASGAL